MTVDSSNMPQDIISTKPAVSKKEGDCTKSPLFPATDLKRNNIQGVFLLCQVFDRVHCPHFSFDFFHRPLIFFGRWDAIEWGIDDNFIITPYRVISQCVKDIFLRKKDRFFEILPQKEEKSYSSDTKFLKSFAFYALKEPVKFEVNRRMSCG